MASISPISKHSSSHLSLSADDAPSSSKRIKRIFFDKNGKGKKDPYKNFDGVLNATGVGSISEMANSLKKEKQIANIVVFAGHGQPSCQELGSGCTPGYQQGKDFMYGRLGDVQKELEIVKDYLVQQEDRPVPLLFLAGCKVAQPTRDKKKMGPLLMLQLSSYLKDVCIVGSQHFITVSQVPKEAESDPYQVFIQNVIKGGAVDKPAELDFVYKEEVYHAVEPEEQEKLTKVLGQDFDEARADLLFHGDD